MSKPLGDIVAAMQAIAPLHLAEEWDNVGLLIQPSRNRRITRLLLTIDLTTVVLDEALSTKAQMIIAYHPPIFSGLKRLTTDDVKQHILLQAIEHRVAIYSPHTALDAAPGGLCDWLCDGLGRGTTQPIHQTQRNDQQQALKVVVFAPSSHVEKLRNAMANAGAGHIGDYSHCSYALEGQGTFLGGASTCPTVGQRGTLEHVDETRLEMVCSPAVLPSVAQALTHAHPYEEPAWDVYALEPKPVNQTGAGRILTLKQPASLATFVQRTKQTCGLSQVRVAAPPAAKRAKTIQTIAVCPGAGGSLFESVQADAYLTGEMRHHDVLEKTEAGSVVVLTDHTNTERGYLPILKRRLKNLIGSSVKINVSKCDADPLSIV